MEELVVGQIMTSGAVTCNPDTALDDVARIMSEADVSAVVVVNAQGEMQGIISQFDLLACLGQELGEMTAGGIMTPEIQSLPPHASLKQAAKLMREQGIHRLIVADEDKRRAAGILSASDIIRAMRGFPV
jgi:CBS domain-containing protein